MSDFKWKRLLKYWVFGIFRLICWFFENFNRQFKDISLLQLWFCNNNFKFQIPDSSRFLVGQYVTIHDDVISHVNISNVKEEDGGEYTCVAQNSIGK